MRKKIESIGVLLSCILGISASGLAEPSVDPVPAEQAERFLRAVYCCEPGLTALSADDVCISYPIFADVLGSAAIRGQAAVGEFSERFCLRWSDPELTIHETVSEGSEVFLLWSFRATPADSPEPVDWGGMSYIRLDSRGRVALELGEESNPGPWARLTADAE